MDNTGFDKIVKDEENFVLDTLTYFRNDYERRIKQSVFLRTLRGIGEEEKSGWVSCGPKGE